MKVPIKCESFFNNIYFTYYDEDSKSVKYEIIKTFKDYYYHSDVNSVILKKEHATKVFVQNTWTKNKEAQNFEFNYESDIKLEKRFIYDMYKDMINGVPKIPLKTAIIDIESYIKGKPNILAPEPITAISIHDLNSNIIYTFAWHPTIQFKDKEKCIICFKTEAEMLDTWLKFMEIMKYNLITGWNVCLSKDQYVWLNNRITKISKAEIGLNLTDDNNVIKDKCYSGLKDVYKIKLENGQKIFSSENHIFPYMTKEKHKQTTKKFLLDQKWNDDNVSNIKSILEKKDIYFKIDLHKNNNTSISYKKLILDNIEEYLNYPLFDFVINDLSIRKNILDKNKSELIDKFGKIFVDNWKSSYWLYSNLKKYISKEEIIKFFSNIDNLEYANAHGKFKNFNLNEIVNNEDLQLLGLIFTDGFYSNYDDNISFCGKDEEEMNYYVSIANNISKSHRTITSLKRKKDGCFYKSITYKNRFGVLLPLIYNKNKQKFLNIELLSQLSSDQFNSFMSGIIDGDGSVSDLSLLNRSNRITICNFNDTNENLSNIDIIQQLLLWNGIYSTVVSTKNINYDTICSIPTINLNKVFISNLNLKVKHKRENLLKVQYSNNNDNEKVKHSNGKYYDNYYQYSKLILDNQIYIKVKSINKLNKQDEMYDIETSTHYFIANGINTHNCQNANGVGYDIPYICNRLNQFKMLERLSPFKKIEKIQWAHHNYFEIFGISIVDYMELYKKFATTKMPSYRLAEISKKELDETKLEYDGDLNSLWMNDIHRFIDYNRKDVELIKKMDDKLHYIELDDELRRIGIVNFEDTIDNANIHDSIVVRFMNHQGYIVKSKKKYPAINYPGGYTYLRWPGIYNFVGDLDFTSLYPFIIRRLNISPETKQKDGEIISEAGIRFTKKFRGAVPSILDWEFQQRNEYKKKMKEAGKIGDKAKEKEYDIKQYAFKILMNSMYGWLGYVGSRLFDLDLSRSVTMTGQVLDKFAIAEAEKEGETVITADTDSLLFTNPNFKSLQEVTKRGHELKDIINKRVEKFVEEKYNVKNEDFGLNEKFVDADYKFNLKNEFAATRGIFFFKRRYCMKIKMREGYDTDKNEFKGVSIVRSSTPEFAKKYLTQLFEIVLTENDYKDKFYKAYAEYGEFVKTADQQILGIPFNISKKLEEYTKILPANVRGCMRWNAMFKDRVNFDEVVKGKYYYLSKVPENYKSYFEVDVTNKKELVLSVPEGFALPDGFEVNRIKHAELTVESPTENLRNIIDDRGYRLMCKYVERLIGKKDKYNEDQRKELRGMLKEVKDDIKKSEIPEKAKEIVDQIIFRDKIKRILDRMTDMGVEDDEEDEE